jgi:hypothetical protein
LAAEFPRGQQVDVDPGADIGSIMTAYWNVALARTAGLLAKTVIDMCSQRLTETVLVRRALMELCANLAVLNQDPANAVRFSLEQQFSNERLFANMSKHGIGSADELAALGAQVDDARAKLEAQGLNPNDIHRYEPFGLKTKDRFDAAGLDDRYYDLLYSSASDYAHMNARAVERMLDHDFGDREAEAELAITTDFLVKILASANEKMGTDLGPDIESLKAEYARATQRRLSRGGRTTYKLFPPLGRELAALYFRADDGTHGRSLGGAMGAGSDPSGSKTSTLHRRPRAIPEAVRSHSRAWMTPSTV